MAAACHRVGWLCTVICSTCYITGSHQRAYCALLPTPPTLISHFSLLLEPCIVTGAPCYAFQCGRESYLAVLTVPPGMCLSFVRRVSLLFLFSLMNEKCFQCCYIILYSKIKKKRKRNTHLQLPSPWKKNGIFFKSRIGEAHVKYRAAYRVCLCLQMRINLTEEATYQLRQRNGSHKGLELAGQC